MGQEVESAKKEQIKQNPKSSGSLSASGGYDPRKRQEHGYLLASTEADIVWSKLLHFKSGQELKSENCKREKRNCPESHPIGLGTRLGSE